MTSTTSLDDLTKCATCKASDKPLLQCGKCKSVKYCGKGCQKAHWKAHKQECHRLAGEASSSTTNAGTSASSESTSDPNAKPFTAIYNGTFLHNRPEEKTFQLLIEILRMRQEDEYSLDRHNMDGSIYCPENRSSEKAFRRFVEKARRVSGFLPLWWTDAKLEECVRYGQRENHSFSLKHSVEKSDVQKQWGDSQMPMKLRMLGEKVWGNTPGGFNGRSMLEMQMRMESGAMGGMQTSHLDLATMLAGRG